MNVDLYFTIMYYITMSFVVWLPITLVVDVVRFYTKGAAAVEGRQYLSTMAMVWVCTLMCSALLGAVLDILGYLHV